MATQERDATLERSKELIKGAEDARAQTLAIAQAQYADQVGEAEKLYGHLGELDKARYDQMVANAQADYDKQVEIANKTHGDTLSIIQQKYADYNAEDMKHLQDIADITDQLDSLESRRTDMLKNSIDERKQELHTETLDSKEEMQIGLDVMNWYDGEQKRLLEDLAQAYRDAKDDNLDSWIGMVANTELYGGELNAETQGMAEGILRSLQFLPDEAKKTMADTMKGMQKEMEDKEPSLFKKASVIAGGILNALRKVFDTHSPSKKMQEITEQLFAGADKPMADASKELPQKMSKVADNVLFEAGRMADIQQYISSKVDASGLGAQIVGVQKSVPRIQTDYAIATSDPVNSIKQNNILQQKISKSSDSNIQIVIPVYLEGIKIAEATAPFNDIVQGNTLAFEGRSAGI
jgi:hypothetical protein